MFMYGYFFRFYSIEQFKILEVVPDTNKGI